MRMQDTEDGTPRLVKIAVKVQLELNRGGNLLMDAPVHQTLADLVKVAGDRMAWRAHSERKFGKKKIKSSKKNKMKKVSKVSMRNAGPKVGRWIGTGVNAVWAGTATAPKKVTPPSLSPKAPAFTPRTLTELTTMTGTRAAAPRLKRLMAGKQQTLPSMWRKTEHEGNNKRTKVGPKKKKGKSKPIILTDAQRAAWAHAHFIIHHGTNQDAARLLTHQLTVQNTPAAALKEIRRMAAMRIPTWTEAAAAVFSSSDESDNSLEVTDGTHKSISMDQESPLDDSDILHDTPKTPAKINNNMTCERQHRTRSTTKAVREEAAKIAADKKRAQLPPPPSRKPKRHRRVPRTSVRPKAVRIAPSQIKGAGQGLYLLEDAAAGEWIARYSGDPLTRLECDGRQHSQYRV